jgi:hypothetical protein
MKAFLVWYTHHIFAIPARTEADAWMNLMLLFSHIMLFFWLPLRLIGAAMENRAYRKFKRGEGGLHFYHSDGRVETNAKLFFQYPKVKRQIEAMRKIPLSAPLPFD